jgi:hypothetical protein
LTKFLSEAIYVDGVNGFTFDDSKLTDPTVGRRSEVLLLKRFIHAILGTGRSSKGEFRVTNNNVNLNGDWSRSFKPHDVQFVGVYGLPKPAFSKIVVSNNTVATPDEAFEILSNDPPQPASIYVENNTINANFNVDNFPITFPVQSAILVTGNLNTPGVYIRNNNLTVANTMAPDPLEAVTGSRMSAIAATGKNFRVENNTIRLNNLEGHAFVIGGSGKIPPGVLDVGTTLEDSVFRNNTLTGSLKGGRALIQFRNDPLSVINKSRRNSFHVNSSLNALVTADAVGLPSVCGNTFSGDVRLILGTPWKPCLFG